jgi:hypothetical protein
VNELLAFDLELEQLADDQFKVKFDGPGVGGLAPPGMSMGFGRWTSAARRHLRTARADRATTA